MPYPVKQRPENPSSAGSSAQQPTKKPASRAARFLWSSRGKPHRKSRALPLARTHDPKAPDPSRLQQPAQSESPTRPHSRHGPKASEIAYKEAGIRSSKRNTKTHAQPTIPPFRLKIFSPHPAKIAAFSDLLREMVNRTSSLPNSPSCRRKNTRGHICLGTPSCFERRRAPGKKRRKRRRKTTTRSMRVH